MLYILVTVLKILRNNALGDKVIKKFKKLCIRN